MKLYLTIEELWNIQSKNQIYQKNASDKSIGYTSLLPRTFKTDLKTTINADLTHAHPPTQFVLNQSRLGEKENVQENTNRDRKRLIVRREASNFRSNEWRRERRITSGYTHG